MTDKTEGFLKGSSYGFAFAVLMTSGLSVLYALFDQGVCR